MFERIAAFVITVYCTAQSQKAVSAYFISEQVPLFGFAWPYNTIVFKYILPVVELY